MPRCRHLVIWQLRIGVGALEGRTRRRGKAGMRMRRSLSERRATYASWIDVVIVVVVVDLV